MSNHLQFGFQKNLSTTFCSRTMMECINYVTNRDVPIYTCLLDLTKAFDHVKHSVLFKKLRGKIPNIFLRLIIVSYMTQSCCVRFNKVDSDSFTVERRVFIMAAECHVVPQVSLRIINQNRTLYEKNDIKFDANFCKF